MEPGDESRGSDAAEGLDHPPKPATTRLGRTIRGLFAGALTVGLIAALGVWWFDVPTSVSAPLVTADAPAVLVTQPPVLPADAITNLAVVQQSTADAQNKRAIAYVRAEGMDGLAELVDNYVLDQIRKFDGEQTEGSLSDELNIGWELTSAAGPYLGVRLTSTVLHGQGPARADRGTVYGDRSGSAVTSRELFTDQGAKMASELIRDVLAAGDETFLLPPPAQSHTSTPRTGATVEDDGLLSDIVFDSAGAVFVVLLPSAGVDEGTEPVAVRIAPDLTAGLLSEIGTRIRAAHVAEDPFVGLPEPAPVTPDPTNDPAADLAGADPSPTSTPEPTAGERTPDAPAEPVEPDTEQSPETEKPTKKKEKPRKKKSSKKVNCAKKKCIALTFDDGPGPHTPRLLKILKKEKVPATFFLIGRNVNVYADVVKTMSKQGHEVASHTWSHPDLRRLSEKRIAKELSSTSKAIKKATGAAPKLMRPPYGAINNKVSKVVKSQGQTAILWDVDTEDWKSKNSKSTAKQAKAATRGSIVLMHDIHPTTVDAVPGMIKAYKKKGYTFVTVSDLLPKTRTGHTYFRQ